MTDWFDLIDFFSKKQLLLFDLLSSWLTDFFLLDDLQRSVLTRIRLHIYRRVCCTQVRPKIRTARQDSIWISGIRNCIPNNLSSLPTAGLTCEIYLCFTSCKKIVNQPLFYIAIAGDISPVGFRLTCRGSKAVPLVITAHKILAFLLAMATAAFCQPAFSFSSNNHFEMGSSLLWALMTADFAPCMSRVRR